MTLKTSLNDNTRILGLKPNVFLLGLVSLLTDISSEMIFTLVPIFLANVLGTSTALIGFIGGFSDSSEAFFKIFSGYLSDRRQKHKSFTFLGYAFSAIARPLMYFASSWGMVAGVRFFDRLGKGVRTAPRDALLAGSMEPHERGRGFGLHKAMDSLGACIGLGVAAIIIYQTQGGSLVLGLETYQRLVLVGILPGILALLLFFLVKESKSKFEAPVAAGTNSPSRVSRWNLGTRFNLFLVVVAIFTLGNSSDFFIILRAQNVGVPLIQITLMLVLFNIVYSLVAWPAGRLSDRLGRRKMITAGWSIYALVYFGLAIANSPGQIWVLFVFYGVYYGIVQGVTRAFVADLIPAERRGTAYGLFHGTIGLTLLPASLIAGWLWDAVNPASTFFFGAALALVAVILLRILVKEPAPEST